MTALLFLAAAASASLSSAAALVALALAIYARAESSERGRPVRVAAHAMTPAPPASRHPDEELIGTFYFSPRAGRLVYRRVAK